MLTWFDKPSAHVGHFEKKGYDDTNTSSGGKGGGEKSTSLCLWCRVIDLYADSYEQVLGGYMS